MLQSSSFVISPRVVNAIRRLPDDERNAISSALANELFLGIDPKSYLSPYLLVIYTFIRDYVNRDTYRNNSKT